MGARHSKRSVDISSTPKKEAAEGGQPAEKLEKIEEGDALKAQNGHAEPITQEGGDKAEGGSTEASSPAGEKAESPVVNGETTEQSGESAPTSPTVEKEEAAPAEGEAAAAKETPKSDEKAEKKKKEKPKKKWSFRSISFSKKDKSKPSMSRDESKSNDLAKEAPVPEEGAQKSEELKLEAETPAAEEPPKEAASPVAVEAKEEPAAAPALDVKSMVSSITSAAESGVQQVVEETTKIVTEAKEAVNSIVEAASKTVIEEIKSTTVTESSSFVKTSTKTIEIVEEVVAPPLPASPPPTEAPPPTPVAPQPIQQHEHEELNGGGEGMAEMPEENGLGENEKLDDEPEHDLPKMNGHNESPVQVEEITECLLKTSIEDKLAVDNHLEVAVGNEKKD